MLSTQSIRFESFLESALDIGQVFTTGYIASRLVTHLNPMKGGYILGLHHIIHKTGELLINQISSEYDASYKKYLAVWSFSSFPITLLAASLIGTPVSILEFTAIYTASTGMDFIATKVLLFAQNRFHDIQTNLDIVIQQFNLFKNSNHPKELRNFFLFVLISTIESFRNS